MNTEINNIIYEAMPVSGLSDLSLEFIIMFIVTLVACVATVILWKRAGIAERCFFTFISIFLAYIVGCQIYVGLDAKANVYDKYVRGEYEIVEGEITEYCPAEYDNQLDEFTVGEKEFFVPGFVSCWGYPIKQADGGVLKDRLKVRICYVEYKFENVIMKIEILD